jgi:hypothetical protein
MSSIRALTQEAHICLDRAQSTAQPVVREVMLRKAAKMIARAEVMAQIGVKEFPLPFVDAVLAQRANGASNKPVVVVQCPPVTREEFVESKKK